LRRRDIEALPGAARRRQSLADSKGAASSGSLLVPWHQQGGGAPKEDSDGDMVMLDNEDAQPARADRRGNWQQTRSGGAGDGKLVGDVGGMHASGDQKPPGAADAPPKRVGASPPPRVEAKDGCEAPHLAAALRRQQQRQDRQQDQQEAKAKQQSKQQQHTAGAAPAQPSRSPSPSADPHRKVRKLTEIYAADAAGVVLPAPPEVASSGGEAVPKRQRTQHAADAPRAELPSKPVSAAGSGPLSDNDGSPVKVANRRSTGSSKGAARRLGGSGVEAHVEGFGDQPQSAYRTDCRGVLMCLLYMPSDPALDT